MATYFPFVKYDESVIRKHPFYLMLKDDFEKNGIDSTLRENGVFGGIVPFYAHPNDGGQLIGFRFEFEYRTTKKDENHWNMKFFNDHNTYATELEVTNTGILKALDIIQEWNIKGIK